MQIRDYRFDNIKGVMIFAVVLGHMLEVFNGDVGSGLYLTIYTCHMPAFVFCTGYFAKFDRKKYFSKIIVPLIIWQIIYVAFDWLILRGGFEYPYATPYWHLWYLMSMAIWFQLIPVIGKWNRTIKIASLVAAVVIALASGYIEIIGYGFSISRTLVFLPFFLAGHYIGKNRSLTMPKGKNVIPILITAAIIALCIVMGDTWQGNWFYGSRSYAYLGYNPGIRLIQIALGALWIVVLLWLTPSRQLPILSHAGKNSLYVFILHGFIVRLIGKWFGPPRHIMLVSAIIISAVTVIALSNDKLCSAISGVFRKKESSNL